MAAPTLSGGTPHARRRRRGTWVALVAAAVAVIVVVASLTYLGWLPGTGGGGTTSPTAFESARLAADAEAQRLGSGSANLTWVVAFVPHVSTSLTANFTPFPLRGAGCTVSASNLPDRNVPSGSNITTSSPETWTFAYTNGTGEFLLIDVDAGVASLAARLEGTSCPFEPPQYGAIPAGAGDLDGSRTTAASAGGYAYLASHPDANASLILVAPRGSVAASGLEWMVTYSECPP
ncbi:MAG TPA: hypothetical protein VEY07_04320, partial [Thermoplasmata archaeon]|nr:hypothetical protein [Thermoplasmata archaeon]